jgi:phosphoglycolate phosphatase
MIKLVVFDWNGTLLADNAAIVHGTNQELAILGLPPIDLATYRRHFDVPLVAFYKNFGVSAAVFRSQSGKLASAFHASYEPLVAAGRTRPGARRVLAGLHGQGYTQIVLSNHTVEGIYLHLKRLRLLPYFAAVLANDAVEGMHFKGKQDRLKQYLQENQLEAAEAVIIGDTVEEVRIGRNLGLKTVSITGGYNTAARLRAARPDAIIHSLRALPTVLEELANG